MAALSESTISFELPDSADCINVLLPSEEYRPYRPPIAAPDFDTPSPQSTGSLNAAAMRQRIAYADSIEAVNRTMKKAGRKLSDRFIAFVSHWKIKCRLVMSGEANKRERKDVLGDIVVMEGELKSRWEALHGPGGLAAVLIDQVHAMSRIRLLMEYGDYLAANLVKVNELQGAYEFQWRKYRDNWQDVAKILAKELEDEIRTRRVVRWDPTAAPTPTPYLDDAAKAAAELGTSREQLIYEINAYASRNAHAHSGVAKLADNASWPELALRIVKDKRSLNLAYEGSQTQEHIQMRIAIERFESLWFEKLWWDDAACTRVNFLETAAAIKRKARIAAKAQRAE